MADRRTNPRSLPPGRPTLTRSRLHYLERCRRHTELPPFIELDQVRYRWLPTGWHAEGAPDGSETLVID